MFKRKIVPDNWFPIEPIQREKKRIEAMNIDFESKNLLIRELISKIKPIKSIKSIDIVRLLPDALNFDILNPFTIKLIPRRGQMATSVGGEIGTSQSVHVSTGYANFFAKSEYLELEAKIRSDKSPKFTLKFTQDMLQEADFSLSKNCFTTYSIAGSYDLNLFKKKEINIASISADVHPKNSDLIHRIAFSMVKEENNKDSPPAFYFDPSPYFKAAVKTESNSIIPSLAAFSELCCLYAKKKLIPYLKLNTNISKSIPKLNLKGSFGGGCILSPCAVPFAEKFKIGGVPIVRGVEIEEFGQKVADFPSGCDAFLSSTLEFFTPIFPEQSINGHFFVNGALAANLKSNNIFDILPNYTSILTFGTGLVFTQGPIQVELNTQLPIVVSEGVKCLKFQIGFAPI